jgi:hypothetical protein
VGATRRVWRSAQLIPQLAHAPFIVFPADGVHLESWWYFTVEVSLGEVRLPI